MITLSSCELTKAAQMYDFYRIPRVVEAFMKLVTDPNNNGGVLAVTPKEMEYKYPRRGKSRLWMSANTCCDHILLWQSTLTFGQWNENISLSVDVLFLSNSKWFIVLMLYNIIPQNDMYILIVQDISASVVILWFDTFVLVGVRMKLKWK